MAERVFSEIAKAKPRKLFVIADGPRTDRPDELERCSASRALINRVDWPCEVLTNYSEINLGCKNRVSSGIDWVFTQVDEAIILEDDCLPTIDFFRFCEEMLARYRDDDRVGMVAGTNFSQSKNLVNESYFFSKYMSIWGWATWRRAWRTYDVEIKIWPKLKCDKFLKSKTISRTEQRYWSNVFDGVYEGQIDTWDYQWVLCNWIQNRLSIVPAVNLISNIGFRSDATHTGNASIYSKMKTGDLSFPLVHPDYMYPNSLADTVTAHAQFTNALLRFIRNRGRAALIDFFSASVNFHSL